MSTYTYEPGRVLRVLQSYVKDPRPALIGIGAYLLSRSQKSFREQRYGKFKWLPRHVPNTMGIVAYLRDKGTIPPLRYLDPTPALVDTGNLRRSVAMQVTSTHQVQVGTTVPYASLMNFGGESSQPVTQVVKDRLRKLLNRQPWQSYASSLWWLLDPSVTEVTVKVPPRPFVHLDDEARAKITDIVKQTAMGKFRVTYL